MANIPFEYLALALEATRGVAVTPPTHYAALAGMLKPAQERYWPEESRGTLALHHRSAVVRKWGEWEGEGGLDSHILPVFLNMAVKAVTTPTTPAGAILSRLWSFVPTMTSDDIKSATLYWGDPAVQIWQGAFAMVDELEIASDGSGTDGSTMSLSGMSQFPVKVSAPALPAQTVGPLITPGGIQVWLDTASAIGTTLISGRVISAEHNLDNQLGYKYVPRGPGLDPTYVRVGRGKRALETTVTIELLDMTQYDLFAAGTTAKLRVRHNGPLIESTAGPVDWYNYVEVDTYGPLDFDDWGDLEGTNRTISLTITSQYDTTLGADFAYKVQNTRTTL